MSEEFSEIEDRALRLSAEGRARLALALIGSLEAVDDNGIEEAWLAEAERRCAELDRGDAKPVPAEEVFADIRRKLK